MCNLAHERQFVHFLHFREDSFDHSQSLKNNEDIILNVNFWFFNPQPGRSLAIFCLVYIPLGLYSGNPIKKNIAALRGGTNVLKDKFAKNWSKRTIFFGKMSRRAIEKYFCKIVSNSAYIFRYFMVVFRQCVSIWSL